jgi:hypothetical protein
LNCARICFIARSGENLTAFLELESMISQYFIIRAELKISLIKP